MLHKWWFYMMCTVFCCTFMNHCNPDSSTKTHISSRTKHVFFNNSSLQKLHISSHPEHAFFQKGSHILSCSANVAQHLEFVAQHFQTNQKPKKKRIPAMVGARIGFLFFGFFVFWFFGFLVFGFWSTKWPGRKCMSSIKIHCKYLWF